MKVGQGWALQQLLLSPLLSSPGLRLDLKLIEDLIALREHGSFVRAAQARHVTHPAFGRRIRALETWAGVPLVHRQPGAVSLTVAATELLAHAQPLLQALQTHRAALGRAGQAATRPSLRIGTGRTLARTLVADWLARQRSTLRGCRVELHTRTMAEIAQLFERGEVDLLCCYEHPLLSVALSPQRFLHVTLAHDRLLPVSRADAHGQARFALAHAPLVAYAPGLALGALVDDHWRAAVPDAAPRVALVCDSADAMLELVLKGLGVAWLPRSLVAADCKRGLLQVLGGKAQELPLEVRLYRPRARQSAWVEAAWAASLK
jgi:LysR family transcriptional regulator, hypochlorite-specific transcription factor HypT